MDKELEFNRTWIQCQYCSSVVPRVRDLMKHMRASHPDPEIDLTGAEESTPVKRKDFTIKLNSVDNKPLPPAPWLPEKDMHTAPGEGGEGEFEQSGLELECYETFESLESSDSIISVELEEDEEDVNAKPKISIAKPSSILEDVYNCTDEYDYEYDNYDDLIIEEVPPSPSPSGLSSNFSPLYGEDVGQHINGDLADMDLEQHMDHLNSEFLSQENKTDSSTDLLSPVPAESSQAHEPHDQSQTTISKAKVENMTLEMLLDDKTFGQNRLRTSITRKKTLRRLAREIPNPIKTQTPPAKSIVPAMSMPMSRSIFPMPSMPASSFAINNQFDPQRLTDILNANIANAGRANADGQQVQIVPILLLATVPVNNSTPPRPNSENPTTSMETQSNFTPKRRKLVHNCTSCPQAFATIQGKKEHMLRCHVGNNPNSAEFTPPPPPALSGLKRLGNLISATSLIKNVQQRKEQMQQERVSAAGVAGYQKRRVVKNLATEYPRTPQALHRLERALPSMPRLTPCSDVDFNTRNWNSKMPIPAPPPLQRISDSNSREEKTQENVGVGGASGCFLNLNDLLDKPIRNSDPNPMKLQNEFVNHFGQLRFGNVSLRSLEQQLQMNPPSFLNNPYLEEQTRVVHVKEELPTLDQELDIQFDF